MVLIALGANFQISYTSVGLDRRVGGRPVAPCLLVWWRATAAGSRHTVPDAERGEYRLARLRGERVNRLVKPSGYGPSNGWGGTTIAMRSIPASGGELGAPLGSRVVRPTEVAAGPQTTCLMTVAAWEGRGCADHRAAAQGRRGLQAPAGGVPIEPPEV